MNSLSTKRFTPVFLFWGSLLCLIVCPDFAQAEAFKDSGLDASMVKTIFFLALVVILGVITGCMALFAHLHKKIDPEAPSFRRHLPNILMVLLILLGIYFFLQIAP